MGLFTPKVIDTELEEQRAALLSEITELRVEIKELRTERGDLRTRDELEQKVAQLRRDLTQKQIDYDREAEKWARERREVEHKVGLQQEKADFDADAARRTAILEVREENLTAAQEQAAKELAFTKEQMQVTQAFLEQNFAKVLERLPDISVDLSPGRSSE